MFGRSYKQPEKYATYPFLQAFWELLPGEFGRVNVKRQGYRSQPLRECFAGRLTQYLLMPAMYAVKDADSDRSFS